MEQLEETVFALMMEEVAKIEGRKALEENERLKADKSFTVPEEMYRKGLSTIKKHFSKNTRQATARTVSKLISSVAVIVLILLLLFTTAFATIPELRTKTLNLIMEVFDDRTRITFPNCVEESEAVEEGTIAGWIPAGFRIVDKGGDGPIVWEKYIDEDNCTLEIWASKADNLVYSVDTENSEVRKIFVGEHVGTVIFKDERIQVVYADSEQERIYDIISKNMPYKDVLHVAERINMAK